MIVRRSTSGTWVTLILLVVVILLAAMTWPVRSTSYLIPAFILVPTAVLLVIQLVKDIRASATKRATDDAMMLARAFAWLMLMPVLLAATGLVAGGALYTLLYLKLRTGESWNLSIATSISIGGGLGVLAYLLRMPQLFAGLIW